MPTHYDVIVAGVGSMGAAACHHLARAGVRVLGLDSQNVPNTNSSYTGNTRVIRLSYFEHPDYVPLLREAYRLWNQIEEETHTQLFHKTGILYLGNPGSPAIKGVQLASRQHGLHLTNLTSDEIRKQHPQFSVPESMVGVFENIGGYLLSEQAVATYAADAIQHGARIQSNEPILNWSSSPNHVTVQTPLNTYHADQLILSTGAWSQPLLQLPQLQLTVTRQIMGWVWPEESERFKKGEFPVWNIDPAENGESAGIYYGYPLSTDANEGLGMKVARHFPGQELHPDQITQEITTADREEIDRFLQRYLPHAQGQWLAFKVCRYTNSTDGHFIVDQHPNAKNVHLACGFSGHGFKFSSVMGKVLADLALEGKTNLPIRFLRLKNRP